MTTIFDQLIVPEDQVASLESAVALIHSIANRTPYIKGGDSSFESFFTTLSNRFVLGQAGSYKNTLLPLYPTGPLMKALSATGYAKARNLVVDIEAGFKGSVCDYFTLIHKDVIPTLLELPKILELLKSVVGAALNGSTVLGDQTGVVVLQNTTYGIDSKVFTAIEGYHTKSSVRESQLGAVYNNLTQFQDSHVLLNTINTALERVDFLKITKQSNGFADLISDLKNKMSRENSGVLLSSKAVDELTTAIARVSTAVRLSVVVQVSMKEWTTALNSSRERLLTQLEPA